MRKVFRFFNCEVLLDTNSYLDLPDLREKCLYPVFGRFVLGGVKIFRHKKA